MATELTSIALLQRPFYFLRHGQSQFNAHKRIAGSIDVALTARGHDEARTAARLLAREPITGIYSSPMQRAHHTAQYAAQALNLPVTLIDEIAERRWGALEGEPRSARIPGVLPTGAETFEHFAARVLRGLAAIDTPVPLLVAHSGVFRVLCHALALADEDAPVSNALPLRIEKPGNRWLVMPVA